MGIGQEMLHMEILVKHLQGLQVALLFLWSLELDYCRLEQWLPCLLASAVLHQGLLVEVLVLSIHLSPEFDKEQTLVVVMNEMVNLQMNLLVVTPILINNLFLSQLKLIKQVHFPHFHLFLPCFNVLHVFDKPTRGHNMVGLALVELILNLIWQ
jgi:hypothetical protein